MLDKICPKCKWVGVVSAILIVLVLLGVIGWLGVTIFSKIKSYSYIGRPEAMRDTITISGEGKVTAIPDIATVSIGLTTEKKEVADAQKENTEKINAIIKALKDLKIEAKDIETSSYSIYPKYDYTESGQKLLGYEVSQQLTVKIRDLNNAGAVLAKAGELGANQAGGLEFTIDEPETLRQEAREKALKNAKEKAEALAEISGVKLGKIVSFSESSNGIEPTYYSRYDSMKAISAESGGGMPSPDIQSGSIEINVYATVVYEIK